MIVTLIVDYYNVILMFFPFVACCGRYTLYTFVIN